MAKDGLVIDAAGPPRAGLPHSACGPLMGMPPSPAFWSALLEAQKAAHTMVRDEETKKSTGGSQWKFSRTESWIELAREVFLPRNLVLTQAAVIEPAGSAGSHPLPPVKGKFVFTLVHAVDGTGWWWAFDWPHYGELRGGPELAWRMTATLVIKYAVRGMLLIKQADEADERERNDPSSHVPAYQPGVVPGGPPPQTFLQPGGYQPHLHGGGYANGGYPGAYGGPPPGAPAPGATHAPGPAAHWNGHGPGAQPGFQPGGVVGGQDGQAHVDQEPVVTQAALMLDAQQVGGAPAWNPTANGQQQGQQQAPQQYAPPQGHAPQQPQQYVLQGVPTAPATPPQQQQTAPRREPPRDGQPDPTYEDLIRVGWKDPFAMRLAALGANDACPDDLREGFLSAANGYFDGDKAAMLAPWASTGFTPLLSVPPGQKKPQPLGVHLRRYAVQLDWNRKNQQKQAAPAAAGR